MKKALLIALICALLASLATTGVRAQDAQAETVNLEEEDSGADVLDDVLKDADAAEQNIDSGPGGRDVEYDEDSFYYPLSKIPPPLPGVDVVAAFRTENFEVGKPTESLITFINNGGEALHIWRLAGSLNNEANFANYIFNLTQTIVNVTIPANCDFSMVYPVTLHERLEPRKYQMALTVFYEKSAAVTREFGASYANTFFNETVPVSYPAGFIDNKMFYILVLVFFALLAAAIGGFKGYQIYSKNKMRTSRYETGTRTTVDDDWTAEHQKMLNVGGGRKKAAVVKKTT
mmetsp:Transcript_6431/g.19473  ORF Transcript_6431/g.19473 Transcript_6431/m.19473 type:complete len:289 (+) Transcript_6431:142-1008(+)